MTKKNKWVEERISTFDDEDLAGILDTVTDSLAKTHDPEQHEIVHITDMIDEIKEEYEMWGKMSGLACGIGGLDNRLLGFRKGDLILIAGETGNGKSALSTNIAVNIARRGDGVLYITLEMLSRQLGARMWHVTDGKIEDLNIMFQKRHSISYNQVEGILAKAISYGEVKMVVLDYMQYLGRGMTNEEVAKMSKEFKRLSLEYEIPFLVIVSLRKSDGGKLKRKWVDIEMEDLMGTAAIGYDCDIAMVASRRDLDNEFRNDRLFVKILKTRNTALDYNNRFVELGWDRTKIIDLKQSALELEAQRVQEIFSK